MKGVREGYEREYGLLNAEVVSISALLFV